MPCQAEFHNKTLTDLWSSQKDIHEEKTMMTVGK